MISGGLTDLNQYTVTALWMYKYDPRTMRSRSWSVGKELIAFLPQPRYICVDVVVAKAQVMQASTLFLKVGRDGALSI